MTLRTSIVLGQWYASRDGIATLPVAINEEETCKDSERLVCVNAKGEIELHFLSGKYSSDEVEDESPLDLVSPIMTPTDVVGKVTISSYVKVRGIIQGQPFEYRMEVPKSQKVIYDSSKS